MLINNWLACIVFTWILCLQMQLKFYQVTKLAFNDSWINPLLADSCLMWQINSHGWCHLKSIKGSFLVFFPSWVYKILCRFLDLSLCVWWPTMTGSVWEHPHSMKNLPNFPNIYLFLNQLVPTWSNCITVRFSIVTAACHCVMIPMIPSCQQLLTQTQDTHQTHTQDWAW